MMREKRDRMVEEYTRLSESKLWQLQRRFFQQQGIEAWRNNIVPSYITSNPFITRAYAILAQSFIQDCRDNLTSNSPIYIIELGAGSGQFAYSFLQSFFRNWNRNAWPTVKYVMTDFTTVNIDYWRRHDFFKPFIEDGNLDFAQFDVEADHDLVLMQEQRRLRAAELTSPLIVIANYFFDSIPCDLFEIEEGLLKECLVKITSEDRHNLSEVSAIELDYQSRYCSGSYYQDESWNRLLSDYQGKLKNCFLSFPTSAINTITRLRNLTRSAFMLLSCDKGYSDLEDMEGRKIVKPAKHGSISFSVNYHAVASYTRERGGLVLDTEHAHNSIKVIALLFGGNEFTQTGNSYQRLIVDFGPDDFFVLKKFAEQHFETLTLSQIMSLLRLSHWDRVIFLGCYDRLIKLLVEATQHEKRSFLAATKEIWQHYLPLQERDDLAFYLGSLLAGIGFYHEAIEFLEISLKLYGEDEATKKNIAVCKQRLLSDKNIPGIVVRLVP